MSMDFSFIEGYGVEFSELVHNINASGPSVEIEESVYEILEHEEPKTDGIAYALSDGEMYIYAYMLSPLKTKNARFWEEEELKEVITKELNGMLSPHIEVEEIRTFVQDNFTYHLCELYI